MATLTLNDADIQELLVILNISLYDVGEMIQLSQDTPDQNTLNEHRELIRRWIHRLGQVEFEQESEAERYNREMDARNRAST